MSFSSLVKRFIQVNWVKTIWYNLKLFPLSQGLHLPLIICNHVVIRELHGGGVILDAPVRFGMFVLGFQDIPTQDRSKNRFVLNIQKGSSIIIKGKVRIGGGTELSVTENAKLVFGDDFYLSLNSSIYCHNMIEFGSHCTVGWNVLIMDTDWHSTYDTKTGQPFSMKQPIKIGNHCWICNDVQIQKGTVIPDNVIVGAKSLCNKKYDVPEYSLIAGIPAVLKKENIGYVR